MINSIPQNDPAYMLWQKVAPTDFEKLSNYLSTSPVRVGEIAEALGIVVVTATLPAQVSGLIKRIGDNNDYEIQVNNTDSPARQRFTVGHEIAHYLLHRPAIGTDGITDTILYRSKLSNRQEAEANKLAAAILLPWNLVNEWHQATFGCPPMAANIDAIATEFRVSPLAAGFRLGI